MFAIFSETTIALAQVALSFSHLHDHVKTSCFINNKGLLSLANLLIKLCDYPELHTFEPRHLKTCLMSLNR